jgi:hypothetical protein
MAYGLGPTTATTIGPQPPTMQSGRWDSNPRPSPWQGDVLPLNHARMAEKTDEGPENLYRRVGYLREWTRSDSNRRSPPCKGGAFPLGHGPMPTRGLEPPRPIGQQILSLQRLPLPPRRPFPTTQLQTQGRGAGPVILPILSGGHPCRHLSHPVGAGWRFLACGE